MRAIRTVEQDLPAYQYHFPDRHRAVSGTRLSIVIAVSILAAVLPCLFSHMGTNIRPRLSYRHSHSMQISVRPDKTYALH